ncbi:PNK3P-domain-containing protein [Xylaria telfairii]|nr:PNK3P-domain-containing protein [Xylaria telfairii]
MERPVAWTLHQSEGFVLVGHCSTPQPQPNEDVRQMEIKVVAIDLNNTLITSKSGTLHGTDESDWRWWHESIPGKLRSLALQGYTVIICSNQGRLTELDGSESPAAAPFKKKMEHILRNLQVDVTLFVACANDIYRKPRPGLWSIIPQYTGNEYSSIDKTQSLVVGDAAGRESDFSDSDVHWAMNAGISFFTPEAFFLGQALGPIGHKFHPDWYLHSDRRKEEETAQYQFSQMLSPMVILVGLPGAGKTTFYYRILQNLGFTRRDARSYNSRHSFERAIDEAMRSGIPIVIDDFNIDLESRSTWISIAAIHGVTPDVIFFPASAELCLHNDTVRALSKTLLSSEDRPIFPRLRFLELVPRVTKPTTDEGLRVIYEVDFQWSGTKEELKIWRKFWV